MSGTDKQAPAPRRWIPTIIRLAVSVALIAVFVTQVGGQDLMTRIASCDPLLFVTACGLFLIGQVLNALRWRWLLSTVIAEPPPLGHLMALMLVGMFFNFFLPSTVGGDVVRAELVRKRVGGRTEAYLSILVGRVLAFVAVLFIGVTAMAAAYVSFGWSDTEVFIVALVFVLAMVGLYVAMRSESLARWWSRIVPHRVAAVAERVRQAMAVYATHPKVLWRVFGMAIIANIFGMVFSVWALAEGLHIAVPVYYHMIVVPLIMLITLVPISFNGIGLREGAFVYFYGKIGVSMEAAVSLSLTFTTVLAVLSLIGGLCMLSPSISWPRRSSSP
jgi:hypothetical protein